MLNECRKPPDSMIDEAKESLKSDAVREALYRLYDHDYGMKLERILSFYTKSDSCAAGHVLFDILDKVNNSVTDQDAIDLATRWVNGGVV